MSGASIILTLVAAIVAAAYVCRVDALSWRAHPVLMAAHTAGALPAVWVLAVAAQGGDGLVLVGALGASVALLVVLYRRMPGHEPPAPPAAAPVPVRQESVRHVAGGVAGRSADLRE